MHHDRVNIYPEIPRKGQEISVNYKGILFQNGADRVWLHYGFDDWKNVTDLQMQRQMDSFHCKIKAEGKKQLQFCFKDSAEHWDNNNGVNWNCPIK